MAREPSSSVVERVITGSHEIMLQMALQMTLHMGVQAIAVVKAPVATKTLMLVLMEIDMLSMIPW